MSEDIKITKDDLVLWLDRPPSNDDLDLCSYLSNAVENQYKYYQELTNLKAIEKEHQRMNGELREENKQLKENVNNAIERLEALIIFWKKYNPIDNTMQVGQFEGVIEMLKGESNDNN